MAPPPRAGGLSWALRPGDIPDTHAEEGPGGARAAATLDADPGHQTDPRDGTPRPDLFPSSDFTCTKTGAVPHSQTTPGSQIQPLLPQPGSGAASGPKPSTARFQPARQGSHRGPAAPAHLWETPLGHQASSPGYKQTPQRSVLQMSLCPAHGKSVSHGDPPAPRVRGTLSQPCPICHESPARGGCLPRNYPH